jgi:hypothetical protein
MRPEGQFAIPRAVAVRVARAIDIATRGDSPMRRPLRVRTVLCAAALGLACVAGTFSAVQLAEAFPKPSSYPIAWQLKFTHSDAKRIVVTTNGSPQAYWYVTFTVTNMSDEEHDFLPNFDMLTKDGKNLPAEKHVPGNVFDEIKKRERNRNLEPLERIAGRLRIGEDQTREGVAIWVEPSTRMGTFHIFVGGLSGESVLMKDGTETQIKDWTKITEEERKKYDVLRKTLDLTFQVSGDESNPELHPARLVTEEWVMR